MTTKQIEEIKKHFELPFRYNDDTNEITDSYGTYLIEIWTDRQNKSIEHSLGQLVAELLNREIGGDKTPSHMESLTKIRGPQ